jgi:hypothetical protein
MNVSRRGARNALWVVFVASMLLEVALVAWARLTSKIYLDDLKSIMLALLAVYSVPLGIMSGGMFARSAGRDARDAGGPVGAAIILSLVWNLLLLGRVAVFALASSDDVDALRDWVTTISTGGSFLVAGALAYYFSSDEAPEPGGGAREKASL